MKKSLALFALLLLTGAGCQVAKAPVVPSQNNPVQQPAAQNDALEGTWQMDTFQQGKMLAQDVSAQSWRFTFEEGVISGKICNTIGGNYGLIEDVLVADELVSTLMYCAGLSSEVEGVLTQDLAVGLKFRIEGDILTLSENLLKRVYTFKRVQ